MSKFNKIELGMEQEHEIKKMNISHPFALKMATLICLSVVSSVVLIGMYLGTITPLAVGSTITAAIILGTISFKFTQSACL